VRRDKSFAIVKPSWDYERRAEGENLIGETSYYRGTIYI